MIAYSFCPKSHKFTGTKECQRDPLESQAQGHDVWLLPAHCTFAEPLPEKDGFDRVWNGTAWEYQEIAPVQPEPTEYEKAQARISELKQMLADSDYVVIKIAEGVSTADDYSEILNSRKAWRAEINELELVVDHTEVKGMAA